MVDQNTDPRKLALVAQPSTKSQKATATIAPSPDNEVFMMSRQDMEEYGELLKNSVYYRVQAEAFMKSRKLG